MPNSFESNEARRKSILATLDEIVAGEQRMREIHHAEAADLSDWMLLGDIVARIERKLGAQVEDRKKVRT